MKSVKNFFKNTLSSTMVIMIVASMMVVASVAASQTIFSELFIDNNGSYCTMTYDGTGGGNNYSPFDDNEAQLVASHCGFVDIHAFKRAIVGSNGSLFDVGYDKSTSEIVLIKKAIIR